MNTYKNLTILGTSHIAKQSIKKVKNTIENLKPHIIAIELDKKRLQALFSNQRPSLRDLFSLGLKAFILNLIAAYAEKKLGKLVGTKPGDEIRQAILSAKEHKLKIALVDQDVQVTLKKLTKRITWKEKFQFIKDIIKSIFGKKQKIKFDLNKVPSQRIINKMIKETKQKYPSVYKTLIEERNSIIAKNLYKLITNYPNKNILAIVGAGHEKAILGELKSKK